MNDYPSGKFVFPSLFLFFAYVLLCDYLLNFFASISFGFYWLLFYLHCIFFFLSRMEHNILHGMTCFSLFLEVIWVLHFIPK